MGSTIIIQEKPWFMRGLLKKLPTFFSSTRAPFLRSSVGFSILVEWFCIFMKLSECINILGAFLGKRDLANLTADELLTRFGFAKADVFVLFGGSILCGADIFAEAKRNGLAKKYFIVGGFGHTTDTLRNRAQAFLPEVDCSKLFEAEIFQAYLKKYYNLKADYLETQSTHCGNNITNLLALLEKEGLPYARLILSQDATMQRRMEATLKLQRPDVTIVNYATYAAHVCEEKQKLVYEKEIFGMWPIERYVLMLLGEIKRLRDDANGYGPKGLGFIAHVDLPEEVEEAYQTLLDSGFAPRQKFLG